MGWKQELNALGTRIGKQLTLLEGFKKCVYL